MSSSSFVPSTDEGATASKNGAAPSHDGAPTDGFAPLGLHRSVLRGIEAAGFDTPRPIQAETIPAACAGRDVLGLAQTGTGKTAAFGLPLLTRLLASRGNTPDRNSAPQGPRSARPKGPRADRGPARQPRALVIAPTRELVSQIDAELRQLGRFTGLRSVTIYGGASARAQINGLRRGADIVLACPGRLLDLINQGALRLDAIETLVLDEADHMFDMGFLPDIKRILALLPKERQNLLFSATMPREIRRLADDLLDDAHVVELAHSQPAKTIEHSLYPVTDGRKEALLFELLEDSRLASAIIFTRTKHRAKRLAQKLEKAGHRAAALQGNMSQAQRDRAMQGFRDRRFDMLVATDIAARGLDVSKVSHVINFDVPSTADAYTHRIGRTGRAEQEGKAFTFVTAEDRGFVRDVERRLGSPIPRAELEGFTTVLRDDRGPGGAKGRKPRNGGGRNHRGGSHQRGRANGDRPGNGRSRARDEDRRDARGPNGARDERPRGPRSERARDGRPSGPRSERARNGRPSEARGEHSRSGRPGGPRNERPREGRPGEPRGERSRGGRPGGPRNERPREGRPSGPRNGRPGNGRSGRRRSGGPRSRS